MTTISLAESFRQVEELVQAAEAARARQGVAGSVQRRRCFVGKSNATATGFEPFGTWKVTQPR